MKYGKDESFELIIDERDLDDNTINELLAIKDGKTTLDHQDSQTLGNEEKLKRKIFEALPSVVSKKIQDVIPDAFRLSEIQLKVNISGTIFGSGISGEVNIKMTPSK